MYYIIYAHTYICKFLFPYCKLSQNGVVVVFVVEDNKNQNNKEPKGTSYTKCNKFNYFLPLFFLLFLSIIFGAPNF